MCVSCFRAAQRISTRATTKSPTLFRNPSRTYRVPTVTSNQLLYLEFLAPSAQRGLLRSIPTIKSHLPTPTSSVTTHRTLATAPNHKPARAIQNPRAKGDGTPMLISLSPRASTRLSNIITTDKNPNLALRVSIESGGCHGFQYLMDLTDLGKSPATAEDTVFEGDKGAKVVIDEASLELLSGSTIDYTMELIGSQFKVTGIPGATSSCGCGTSFDIKI